MRRKRILYVEQNTDGTVGGSHFCLLDTVRHLDRERFDPLVIFYEENSLLDEFRRQCPVFILPVPAHVDITSTLSHTLGWFRAVPRLAQKGINLLRCALPSLTGKLRLLRTHRVDLVHLNNAANRGYDWVLACRMAGVRCITHNRGLNRLSGPDKFFARRFDVVVSIAGFLADDLRLQGAVSPERSVVINDGIDPDDIVSRVRRSPSDVRQEFGLAPDDPLIGIVGNVREWKGQAVVIGAVNLLKEKYPALRCFVIGEASEIRTSDRDYLHSIESFVAGHGLCEAVRFLGFRDDVLDIVNSLDILVHASISPEPFGRVILEGMVLEKPIVATNFGGPLEIIEDRETGFLVPPGNESALAEAIDVLLEDAPMRERIARAGKRRAERFHIKRYMEDVHDLYDRIVP
jgi:glycosyltransferase involved in cell wall biosynthesis